MKSLAGQLLEKFEGKRVNEEKEINKEYEIQYETVKAYADGLMNLGKAIKRSYKDPKYVRSLAVRAKEHAEWIESLTMNSDDLD